MCIRWASTPGQEESGGCRCRCAIQGALDRTIGSRTSSGLRIRVTNWPSIWHQYHQLAFNLAPIPEHKIERTSMGEQEMNYLVDELIEQGYQILFYTHIQVQTTKTQGQNSKRWIWCFRDGLKLCSSLWVAGSRGERMQSLWQVLRLCGRWFQRHHEMRLAERFQQCLKDMPSAAGNWSLLGALPRNGVSWCHVRFAIWIQEVESLEGTATRERAPVHGIH